MNCAVPELRIKQLKGSRASLLGAEGKERAKGEEKRAEAEGDDKKLGKIESNREEELDHGSLTQDRRRSLSQDLGENP